jgi:hypothetical protein
MDHRVHRSPAFGNRKAGAGITYIGQSFGSEWVILRIVDGHFPTSLVSRNARRRFFDLIQAKNPGIRIYRAYKT